MQQITSLPDELVRVAFRYFEGLGTPFALGAAIRLRHGDWDGLARLSVDPRCYIDSTRYAADNAAACFLKKLAELPNSTDRRAEAVSKWWAGEKQCYSANERLSGYLQKHRGSNPDLVPDVDEFFSSTRKIVLDWLGARPPDLIVGRHGPGATFSDKGRNSTVPDKMFRNPSLTRDSMWYLPQWFGTQWGAAFASRHGELSWTRGNRFTTVPKTSLTDRSIAVEPSINVFYQLALGKAIRRRLRNNTGWDLDHAQDVHRQVACESSVTCEFATLDLSNASDTVARNLVELLLPPGWFDALDDLRSKHTRLDNRWVRLEKFSSMGNGFTFELETIIFAALACATVRKNGGKGRLGVDVFVFGDDIILPDGQHQNVEAVLRFCGFSLNTEKSYFGGVPFRESCGGDFFAGKPVRGYYLKQLPSTPTEVIAFANGVKAMEDRYNQYGWLSPKARLLIVQSLPTRLRLWGPQALGDTVLWSEDSTQWTTRTRWCVRMVKAVKVRTRITPYKHFDGATVLACATYGLGNTRPSADFVYDEVEGFTPRDGVSGFNVGWIPYS